MIPLYLVVFIFAVLSAFGHFLFHIRCNWKLGKGKYFKGKCLQPSVTPLGDSKPLRAAGKLLTGNHKQLFVFTRFRFGLDYRARLLVHFCRCK
jgi:hypothetical protein